MARSGVVQVAKQSGMLKRTAALGDQFYSMFKQYQ